MTRLTSLTPMCQVNDLSQTIRFYRDVLGFHLECAWPDERPTWCHLSRDDVRLMFYTDAEQEPRPPAFTGVLYLRTDNVLDLYDRLKDRVKIKWGPEVYHYGMHEFAIEDCNGYTLSFGQPTKAPPTCPEP